MATISSLLTCFLMLISCSPEQSGHYLQKYPVDGILRCKCGAEYKFIMKNQPRWVCTKNPAHYQIMRESDLKLEKMRDLIPTKKALKEVEKYFSDKRKEYEKEQPVKGTPVKKSADKQYRPKDKDDQLSLFE